MSDVYQCPSCPLRFANQTELEMHRKLDHPTKDAEPEYDDEQ